MSTTRKSGSKSASLHEDAKGTEHISHVEASSAALVEALAKDAKISTRSLVRLYVVMVVGYLVLTIQGFGKIPS